MSFRHAHGCETIVQSFKTELAIKPLPEKDLESASKGGLLYSSSHTKVSVVIGLAVSEERYVLSRWIFARGLLI